MRKLEFATMDRQKLVASIAVSAAVLTVSGMTMLTRHATAAADKDNLKKQRTAAGMPDMEAMRARMLEQTAKELGLTESQKAQWKDVQDQMGPGRDKPLRDKSLTHEQRGQQMRQARAEQEARLRAILTPEQQAKYDQMQAARHAEGEKRRSQGANGRAGGGLPGGATGGPGGGPPGGMPPGPPPDGGPGGMMGGPPPDGFGPPPDGGPPSGGKPNNATP